MRHEEELSLGDLFSELSADTSKLVRQEVMLAKAEISQKISRAGKDVAILVAGGLLAYTGVLTLTAALVLIVSLFMPSWVAASIIGLLILGIGYLLVQKGLNDLKKVAPMPEKTIQTLKEDKAWLQHQVG
jgi:hypothetical protein